MKITLLFIAALFICATTNAQSLTVKNNGNVYDMNNDKWTPKEVRDILAENPAALKSYNSGRSKKTWGNFLLYGGLAMATTNAIIGFKSEVPLEQFNFIPAVVGTAMAIIAIPVKIGHSKKVKKAIELHNENNNKQVIIQSKVTFTASQSQVGLLFAF